MVTEPFENRPVSMNEDNHLLQIEEHMYILDDVSVFGHSEDSVQ